VAKREKETEGRNHSKDAVYKDTLLGNKRRQGGNDLKKIPISEGKLDDAKRAEPRRVIAREDQRRGNSRGGHQVAGASPWGRRNRGE